MTSKTEHTVSNGHVKEEERSINEGDDSNSSFADALSESHSIMHWEGGPDLKRHVGQGDVDQSSLTDSVMSLSTLLPVGVVPSSEQVQRQQRVTAALLSMDENGKSEKGGINENPVLNTLENVNSLTRTVGSWVKSATSLLLDKSATNPNPTPGNSPTPTSCLPSSPPRRVSVPGNIVQRASPLGATNAMRIVDATDSICSWPNCVQTLNIAVSRFHCRKCNGWYCDQHAGHASLGMKLCPATGEPDPNGVWSRVCQRCFQERLQVRDREPAPSREHTQHFAELRTGYQLEAKDAARRLEQRYHKLALYFEDAAQSPQHRQRKQQHSSSGTNLAGSKRTIPFRLHEQQVVKWEDDLAVKRCRQCQIPFGALQRKHHCRLCGQIICADCSHFKSLHNGGETGRERGEERQLRICGACDWTLFRRLSILSRLSDTDHCQPRFPEDAHDKKSNPPMFVLYAQMRQIRSQISDIMPRFNDQLVLFEEEIDRMTPREDRLKKIRFEAATARDTLMLLFRHYEQLMRQISLTTTTSSPSKSTTHGGNDERIIKMNIRRAALSYLQGNMFTLQMLPKLDLKRLRKPSSMTTTTATAAVKSLNSSASKASSIRGVFQTIGLVSSSSSISPKSNATATTAIALPSPVNISALRVKRVALDEQRDQLDGYLAEAAAAGRFDDVISLRAALEEINQEALDLDRVFRSYEQE